MIFSQTLAQSLQGALAPFLPNPSRHNRGDASGISVPNASALYAGTVARVVRPTTSAAISQLLRQWSGPVCVGGGRYSMGGQIAYPNAMHLDMRGMASMVWLDVAAKRARVLAGATWRTLQEAIDPFDLAVRTMQSFSNFTVGGAVSVNAHGRYLGHGPVGGSVSALQLVLADGAVVEASRTVNVDLFRAAIGGYGAIGVITEVELELADNINIERHTETVTLDGYAKHFSDVLLADPANFMHNADLLPPLFDQPFGITWKRSGQALTMDGRLTEHGKVYRLQQRLTWLMMEVPGLRGLRKHVLNKLLYAKTVVKRLNLEASRDVAELDPKSRHRATFALQEYFVAPDKLAPFVRDMVAILKRHQVPTLNITIRHSPTDNLSLMAWARGEVFSVALYHKQKTTPAAQVAVGNWTRELVELALSYQGTYYLPYQMHATRAQFERAYPQVCELRALKKRVDPDNKLLNGLWGNYL
jgi:FAD/FMN-containing dehydrogenase